MDHDVRILKRCCRLLDASSPQMMKANLDFLYDKYVLHLDEPARLERQAVRANVRKS